MPEYITTVEYPRKSKGDSYKTKQITGEASSALLFCKTAIQDTAKQCALNTNLVICFDTEEIIHDSSL